MNKTISEPPGRLRSKQNVFSFPNKYAPVQLDIALPSPYLSVDDMVESLRPEEPVQALRPAVIASAAKWFLRHFPGDVMYAVKCNPDARILRILARAGIKHYDVASLAEVRLVAETLPGAKLYFMHPVKSRHAIRDAYFQYGVRDFSLDSHDELEKILETTQGAEDLNLYVRLAIPNNDAVLSLSGKFGIELENAASLIIAARKSARKLGICFHVGSQCMNPDSYANAVNIVVAMMEKTGVKLDVLDVGGGFPSIYPSMTPPPLSSYMKIIKKAIKTSPLIEHAQIICEPGRALVAEGASMVVQVDARKGNMLFINDGIYGSLFDAGIPGFIYPARAIRSGGEFAKEFAEFGFYGPTCDSLDAMKGPFILPADIREGDWIEIGQLGAYGQTMRTNFNGFFADITVEVMDKPLMSIFATNSANSTNSANQTN